MKRIIILLFIFPALLYSQDVSISGGEWVFNNLSLTKTVKTDWTWCAFGDSFTLLSGESFYIDEVEDIIVFDSVMNNGYSNQPLSVMYDYLLDSLVDPNWLDDVDIITFQFGHNDFKDVRNKTLGGVDAAASTSTIAGTMKLIIDTVFSTNAAINLYFITPVQRFYEDTVNANGWGVRDLSDTANAICDIYGINCIDWTTKSGFNIYTIDEYIPGGHPLPAGKERLSKIVIDQFLKEY